LFGASPALAAGFAEDHTILYYLIEMQRRATRTCNGTLMPEAPSLMPSESLRRIAALSASSGRPVAQIAAESGLSDIPYLATTAHGSNPRQVFNVLVSGQCSAIMNPEFHYIGASAQNGTWTLIMAATEPGLIPLPRPDTTLGLLPDPILGTAPEITLGTTTPTISTDETTPPDLTVKLGGHRINPNSEFAPADPIIMHQFHTDGRGRLVPADPEPGPAPTSQAVSPGPRPGITPLEDTRPPEAVPDDGITILVPQTPMQPNGAPALAPWQPPTQPTVQPDTQRAAAPAPVAPAVTMPVRTAAQTTATGPQEVRMLELINAARAKGHVCGGTAMPATTALRGDGRLDAAAREHTRDLTARRYFSSTTPEGRNLGQRVTDSGYAWSLVAENLLAGRSLADDAIIRWLGNENQCRNLMDREFEDIGIGFDPAGPFWSIILAAPLRDELPTQ
jgi:uncharacterized protein YkwD